MTSSPGLNTRFHDSLLKCLDIIFFTRFQESIGKGFVLHTLHTH
jgi:hypothetical protein